MSKHFAILFLLFVIFAFEKVSCANCPPLRPSQGALLICTDPGTRVVISCNQEMPPQTTVDYQCVKYYTTPMYESTGGKMTCQSNGVWSRLAAFQDFRCRVDCGKASSELRGASPAIVFGKVATRENFPWHATIFQSEGLGTGYRFLCGGSLVNPSNKGFLVVTAAHCVTASLRTKRLAPLEDFSIVLGSLSSSYATNSVADGTQMLNVKAIKIHPKYNYDTVQNDIAVIQLEGSIQLSNYVSPACFPSTDMAHMEVKGHGFIPGYGVDESGSVSRTLKYANLPVADNDDCNYALGKELTSVEFCAGYQSGASICSGDSGGGLVFENLFTKKFYLQGIASNVDWRPLQSLNYCQNYNTFTRVSSYVDWVERQLDDFLAGTELSSLSSASNAGHAPTVDQTTSQSSKPHQMQGQGWSQLTSTSYGDYYITVFQDYDDRNPTTTWHFSNCSAIPERWNTNGKFWMDLNGKCLQFFEGKNCFGKFLEFRSSGNLTVFEWNYPQYTIRSVKGCPVTVSKVPVSSSSKPTTIRQVQASPTPTIDTSGSDYEKVGLQKHNMYRMKHGVQPLRLSSKLNIEATKYAADLMLKPILQPSSSGYGENLYEIYGSFEPFEKLATQSVELWYNSIDKYNWRRPSATSFSQIVWKATEELGIGVARAGRRTVIVARYSPPGNIYFSGMGDRTKYFRENVFPPRRK